MHFDCRHFIVLILADFLEIISVVIGYDDGDMCRLSCSVISMRDLLYLVFKICRIANGISVVF